MKRLFLALLLGAPLSVSADEVNTAVVGETDPLYLQLYLGMNKSVNENLPFTEFTQYPISYGMFVGLGKEVSPVMGWRAALRFNHNKSRNVQKCELADTWGWNSLGFFGDATFDITDALNRKPLKDGANRKFNLKAFAGVGVSWTYGFDEVPLSYTVEYSRNSCLVPAFRAGLTATWRVSDKWRVGAELSQTAFADNFNGVKTDIPLDTRSNLKIGVTYLFDNSP